MSKNNDPFKRHVGRNVRPPCLSCKPDLSIDNILFNSDNSCRPNEELHKLSLFFTDPASKPYTTQSPARSPTSFPALLSALPPNTTTFPVLISTPTPFDSPLLSQFGLPIIGQGQATKNSDGVFFAFVTFSNLDLTNFNSGDNMYMLLPGIFPCNPKFFGGNIKSVDPNTNLTNSCLVANPPTSPGIVSRPIQIGLVSTSMIFTNVVTTSDLCSKVSLSVFWSN